MLLAACGALSYGVTVVIGEDLADAGLGSSTALGFRFIVTGVILAIVLRLRRVAVVPATRPVMIGAGLGLIYALESALFFSGLERGSAAAVALVFYVYPAMVTVFELVRGTEHAHRTTIAALVMSMVGTAIVAVGGGRVAISPGGVAFALGAATAFSAYLLLGRDLTRDADPMLIACWVGIGAGVANLTRGAAIGDLSNPSGRTLELLLYAASTATAFTLTFAAMRRIGAARVAVIMTLEAASSVVMAAVFLGETVKPVQAVGGAVVLVAAAVIARGQPRDIVIAAEASPAAGT